MSPSLKMWVASPRCCASAAARKRAGWLWPRKKFYWPRICADFHGLFYLILSVRIREIGNGSVLRHREHRSSTTKDTTYHEGFNLRFSFVNLRVLCGLCFSKLTHYREIRGRFRLRADVLSFPVSCNFRHIMEDRNGLFAPGFSLYRRGGSCVLRVGGRRAEETRRG